MAIEYELAGIASRAGAAIIDMILQTALILAVWLLGYGLSLFGRWRIGSTWASVLLTISSFLILYGYYLYFETVWNGQTPGKRYARMRAIREGGLPIDLSCAAVRNVVRIVDFLPGFYLLGGAVALFSSSNKRLGDYAAGTLVVKELASYKTEPAAAKQPVTTHYAEAAYVKNIELVTPREFEAVCTFLDRQAELQADVREQLAAKIAKPLMVRLGIENDPQMRYSALLTEIRRRCIEERGMR